MAKHFVVNPKIEKVDRAEIAKTELDKAVIHKTAETAREKINRERLEQKEDLKYIDGRVVVKVDLEKKNFHQFSDGTKIRRERKYNNFNRRETEPVNAVVISAEYIPEGCEILVGHNSLHDTNKIFDYTGLSGKAEATDIRYYSLPEDDCFAWRDENGEMQPLRNYAFGLRVYKPYTGALEGIEPEKVKDVLWVTTGELKGNVVNVLPFSDYEIIFQDLNGVEGNIIRFRHSDDCEFEREEVICINHDLTEKVLNGELLVGLSTSDAKKLNNAY